MENTDYRDRRKHPRFEGHFQVDLLNMGDDPHISSFKPVIPSVALDVSKQGLRLKSSYNVKVGSFLSTILYFRNQESICLCEVMWKREANEESGQYFYGLFIKEWSKLDPELEVQLSVMEKMRQAEEEDFPHTGQSPVTSSVAIA